MMLAKTKKTKKASRPTRDEFELEELANQLVEALEEGYEVFLHIWQREPIKCRITKLDGQTQLVYIEEGNNSNRVKFIEIIKVESVP